MRGFDQNSQIEPKQAHCIEDLEESKENRFGWGERGVFKARELKSFFVLAFFRPTYQPTFLALHGRAEKCLFCKSKPNLGAPIFVFTVLHEIGQWWFIPDHSIEPSFADNGFLALVNNVADTILRISLFASFTQLEEMLPNQMGL